MKVLKNKSFKIGIAVIVVITLSISYFLSGQIFNDGVKNNKSDSDINYEESTDEQKKAGEDIKRDFLNRHGENYINSESQKQESSSQKASLSISNISYSNNNLSVRTIISNASVEGECKIRVISSNGENILEQSVNSQKMNSYYTCRGFDIYNIDSVESVIVSYSDRDGNSGEVKEEI